MLEGFIKYDKNSVVQISQITTVWVWNGKIHFETAGLEVTDDTAFTVGDEYQDTWIEMFDLYNK